MTTDESTNENEKKLPVFCVRVCVCYVTFAVMCAGGKYCHVMTPVCLATSCYLAGLIFLAYDDTYHRC